MPVTRIKNNQITDSTIDVSSKVVDLSVTAGKLENDLVYASNLTVSGNLLVNGTTTTLNTATLTVEDPLMLLASGQTGVGAVDIGFIAERGTDTNVAFVWDESADQFAVGFTASSSDVTEIVISSYADIKVGALTTTSPATFTDLHLTGDLLVDLTSEFTGLMTAGDIDSTTLDTTAAVTVGTTLGVTGLTTLSTLDTTGLATLESATITNLLSANGGITVDAGVFTVADVTGNIATNGTLLVSSTSTFSNDVLMSTNLVVSGNLTVNGTTTTLNTEIVEVADPAISLGEDAITDSFDRGLLLKYNDGAPKFSFVGIDLSATELVYVPDATDTSGVYSGALGKAAFGSLRVTDLTATRLLYVGVNGELQDDADLTFDGTTLTATAISSPAITATGTTTLVATGVTGVLTVTGSAAIDNITIDGNGIEANAGGEVVVNDLGADVNFRVEGDTNVNALFVDATTNSVNIGTATPVTDVALQVGTTDAVIMPKGTTAQRPAVPVGGMLRYNTSFDIYEYYNAFTSLWEDFGVDYTLIASETFTGDNATTIFTLASSQTSASCIVSLDGVVQVPTSDYSVVGVTLTFVTAPANLVEIEVRELTTTITVVKIENGDLTAIIEPLDAQAIVQITGDLNPAVTGTQDLGSASKVWADIYGTTIYEGGVTLSSKYLSSTTADSAGGLITFNGGIDLIGGIDGSLTIESGKHAINSNDGGGNFNIRVANHFTTGCTEDGYASHWAFTQASGSWSFNVSSATLAVNDTPTWYTQLVIDPNAVALRYQNVQKLITTATGVTVTGEMSGTATAAQYADLAENYVGDAQYEPGTIVSFGGVNEVTQSSTDADKRVAGVVSTNPAHLMNSGLESEFVIALALRGRVPCKVQGTVRKGDLMVSAGNGRARAEEDPRIGQVLGKALEDSDGEAIIEVVIGQ